MTTTIVRKHIETVAKAPDAAGTFEGRILYNPSEGDTDNERVASWSNITGSGITLPLLYQHAVGDKGAKIGTIRVIVEADGRHLSVRARLDMSNPMSRAIHERLLLPDSNELALRALSVGFAYDSTKTTKDPSGVTVIHDAELLEISVVYRGAQPTEITNVKDRKPVDGAKEIAELNHRLGVLDGSVGLAYVERRLADIELAVQVEEVAAIGMPDDEDLRLLRRALARGRQER